MNKLASNVLPMMVVIAISGALAPTYRAQVNSLTRVYSVPSGTTFYVDGQAYMQGTAASWLIGSRHVLWVQNTLQDYVLPGTRYRFTGWSGRNGGFDGNPLTVTASIDETEYRANFDTEYLVRFQFGECGRSGCENGGIIQGDGGGAVSGSEMWVKAGSELTLTAAPKPGFVFVGWRVGPSQVIQGVENRLTVKSPVTLVAQFQPVRPVEVLTSPENMQILVDQALARAPYSSEWGWATPHTLDVVSPQQDSYGKTWVFDSWSDGGTRQHIYNVGESAEPLVFTAKFVPGAGVTLATSPQGLNLVVDGQAAAPPYYFWWRELERHTVEAPARQTDQHGRWWTFTGWSNGAAERIQEFTVPQEGIRLVANYALVGRITIDSTMAGAAIKVDGADCATPCSIEREVGSEIRLSAPSSVVISEATRGDFAGWTGSGASADSEWTVKLNGDPQAVWANYRLMNRLVTTSEPAGGARWTMTPSSADGFYEASSTVNVAVAASPGYEFLRFEGDLNGIAKQGVLSMSSPRSVRAMFNRTPFVQPKGVVNAAGATPDAVVAAGSIVSVYGASLSEESVVGPASPMSQTLAGVTVRIGDRLVPLFFVSPDQINLQLPTDLTPATYTMTVSPFGSKDVTAEFTVARNAPGVFQRADLDKQIALAMHEDGSVVSTASPARKGELLLLYGTGFGPLNRPRLAGLAIPESPAFTVTDPVELLLGDTLVQAEQAYAAPGLVGVDVARFRIPEGVPAGSQSLRIRIDQRLSNTVALPVQ